MEAAINMLVETILTEYKDTKKDIDDLAKMNEHLNNQVQSLYAAEESNAESRRRLRELLAPTITWEKGEGIYLSLFDKKAIAEICKLLKIEEHSKALI